MCISSNRPEPHCRESRCHVLVRLTQACVKTLISYTGDNIMHQLTVTGLQRPCMLDFHARVTIEKQLIPVKFTVISAESYEHRDAKYYLHGERQRTASKSNHVVNSGPLETRRIAIIDQQLSTLPKSTLYVISSIRVCLDGKCLRSDHYAARGCRCACTDRAVLRSGCFFG